MALAAAIDAGADAVYFGSCDFNARKHATNFTPEAMREAIKLAHAYGVKVYITQNTLILDRVIPFSRREATTTKVCSQF